MFYLVQRQILFLYILWLNLFKVIIDVLPKPFVPIGNLQQSSEGRVVAVFELLGIQQVFTELLAQIHIHITKGTLSLDEVVEMLIDELPFLVFVPAHLFEVGEEVGFLFGLVQEAKFLVDERLHPDRCRGIPCGSSALFLGYGLPDNNPDIRRYDYSESLSDGLLLLYTCVTYCLIFRVLHLFGAKE